MNERNSQNEMCEVVVDSLKDIIEILRAMDSKLDKIVAQGGDGQ